MSSDNNNNSFTDVPIRDALVNTAINFLKNPGVQKRHNNSKIAFLKKKGLTDIEISAAFDQIKGNSNEATPFEPEQQYHQVSIPPPYQPYSFWSQLSGISSSLIVFGVAIYGLHHFYKKYIKPWILGEETESDSLTKSIRELNDNMIKLTENVGKLHTLIMKQNEDVNKLVQLEGYAPTAVILEDLKREMSSVKSILISRHQFPAAPQVQSLKASIPSWQLPSCQDNLMYADIEDKCLKVTAYETTADPATGKDPVLSDDGFYIKDSDISKKDIIHFDKVQSSILNNDIDKNTIDSAASDQDEKEDKTSDAIDKKSSVMINGFSEAYDDVCLITHTDP